MPLRGYEKTVIPVVVSMLGGKAPEIRHLLPSQDCWSLGIKASVPSRTLDNTPSNISREGPTGVEGAGGSGGPGCGARGRWRGLAGLRDDAPSEARGADGERAGRRPRAHRAARPSRACQAARPSRACQAARPSRACQAARPDKAHAAPGTPVGQHNNTGIQAERPASSVARWTPPRPASWAAWVRHEKPSARYTASGCAARDGSSECDATTTDRS